MTPPPPPRVGEPGPVGSAEIGREAVDGVPVQGVAVALVIDDLGRSLEDVESLLALGVPLSFSVLPYETLTEPVADELARRHAEVLLHLPMQPEGGQNPGPGALTLEMGPSELSAAVQRALAQVPGAAGVNNHMGSGFTADRAAMEVVVRWVAQGGRFYLDSRTSVDSLGYAVARAAGVPTAARDVFLDEDREPAAVRAQFRRLLDVARAEGSAIAIGHPHAATLEVLRDEVPRAVALGYRFVPVSALMERPHEVG